MIRVDEVRRLAVEPGDTLVFTLSGDGAEPGALERFVAEVKQFHPQAHVIVMDHGSTVTLIRGARAVEPS